MCWLIPEWYLECLEFAKGHAWWLEKVTQNILPNGGSQRWWGKPMGSNPLNITLKQQKDDESRDAKWRRFTSTTTVVPELYRSLWNDFFLYFFNKLKKRELNRKPELFLFVCKICWSRGFLECPTLSWDFQNNWRKFGVFHYSSKIRRRERRCKNFQHHNLIVTEQSSTQLILEKI